MRASPNQNTAGYEGDESDFVPGRSAGDAGRTRAVKANESASSPTAALSHSGREAARISFVWPAYEGDESGFMAAAPKADEGDESGFVAAAPKADEGDESAFGCRSPV